MLSLGVCLLKATLMSQSKNLFGPRTLFLLGGLIGWAAARVIKKGTSGSEWVEFKMAVWERPLNQSSSWEGYEMIG